jgi:hypothetical protein
LLKAQKFSLRANRKTADGADNPDRDAQFRFINAAVETALAENQPVISVDTKKKELVGDFKNAGREWRPQSDPEEVRVHDFLIKELGRAAPYGIYDLAANTGLVNVGIDNDTAAFAMHTIRRWRQDVGRVRYPLATRLLITAGWRRQQWFARASVRTPKWRASTSNAPISTANGIIRSRQRTNYAKRLFPDRRLAILYGSARQISCKACRLYEYRADSALSCANWRGRRRADRVPFDENGARERYTGSSLLAPTTSKPRKIAQRWKTSMFGKTCF